MVCNAAGDQTQPVMVADGAGGAIVAWNDHRLGGNGDIFVQRVTGTGVISPGWPVNGRLISSVNETKDEDTPQIVSDGANGAVVVWRLIYTSPTDFDVYGARVNASGTLLWSSFLYAPSAIQDAASPIADGGGGAIVVFEDSFAGNMDIRALHVNSSGFVNWGPVDVCNQVNQQTSPVTVSDGLGGFYVVWQDDRYGNYDLFASHFTASGSLVPGWSSIGLPVTTAAGFQTSPYLVADSNHGAIVGFADLTINQVLAHHLQPGGIDPSWPVNGTVISPTGGGFRITSGAASDGSGGAIVAWTDSRGGSNDVYANRVTASGLVPAPWPYWGTPISAAPSSQTGAVVAADGNGGTIFAWNDLRDGVHYAAWAQNVDHFGQLGDATPAFTSLKDVSGDQGGHVRLAWNASYLDADPAYAIGEYWIWRQTSATAAAAAVAAGGRWLDGLERTGAPSASLSSDVTKRGLYLHSQFGAATYTWEYLAAQKASGFPQYSYVASTTRDSSGYGNPYTVFMVQARYASGSAFWNSAPDSTYSVDNLPPLPPTPFTGAYAGGGTHLHWGANGEADLAGYRLYRGLSSSFVPGAGNLVAAQSDTGYVDAGAAGSYYKLSAVDVHGNESGFALLTPGATLGVTDALPHELGLALASMNPARSDVLLRVALPSRAPVSLAVYDATGRLVRRLVTGEMEAGVWTERWDGATDRGRSSANGLYFALLRVGGREIVQRIVLAR